MNNHISLFFAYYELQFTFGIIKPQGLTGQVMHVTERYKEIEVFYLPREIGTISVRERGDQSLSTVFILYISSQVKELRYDGTIQQMILLSLIPLLDIQTPPKGVSVLL